MQNLITNSRDAFSETSAGKNSIQFTTDLIAGGVHLRYQDNASGMGPDVLKNLFTPFFTTKTAGQGTGLGMALIHQIVQEHQGKITVESQVGQGSVFELFFPLYQGQDSGGRGVTDKGEAPRRQKIVEVSTLRYSMGQD